MSCNDMYIHMPAYFLYKGEESLDELLEKKYSPMTETTYYTLLSVKDPRHGYAIMQYVNELTNGRIRMGTGTLYTMLGRLLEDNLIVILSQENGKKIYQITERGTELIKMEMVRLSKQLQDGMELFRGDE
jgi:DNA-binding PadR family transcriptional regulator